MARPLVTRRVLAREIALNAATRPLNVAVPVGVAVAALLLSLWLLPFAVLVYGALVATTLFDGDVAESVGREVYAKAHPELPPGEASPPPEWADAAVAEKLALAREAEQRIRRAIAESPVPLVDVETEVERLMHELGKLGRQADRVSAYLADENEAALRGRLERLNETKSGDPHVDHANAQTAAALLDQIEARSQLARQLSRLDAQMEHIVATLGVIHAQIVRMSVAEEASAQARVAKQVRELRCEIGATAEALDEAYRDLD